MALGLYRKITNEISTILLEVVRKRVAERNIWDGYLLTQINFDPYSMEVLSMYQLGIDTGGTFNDFVLVNEDDGSIVTYKESSTPGNPADAVMKGVERAEKEYGVSMSKISRFVYGTTVATNALLEKKGAKTGLLTTKGFRDVLEMRRQWKPILYDLYYIKDPPLVPRYLRLEVGERIDAKGKVLHAIDLEEVRKHVRTMIAEGVEAIAVVFLFSFLNPVNEKVVEELIRKEFPQIYLSVSYATCPEFREYERASTTVLNAYLMPIMSKYMRDLRGRLTRVGITKPLRIMQSNGGLMRAEDIEESPINTLLSGPVGGVVGCIKLAKVLGLNHIITLDMGGTSTDICLVQDGNIELITEAKLAEDPVKVPQVNIHTIGAGGGSIINVFGRGLKVGPQSAGATPGPVCYRRGGTEPTSTDAALQVGFIDPQYFLGGEMQLDYDNSRRVLAEKVAKPLEMTTEEAADAALIIQSLNIVNGIRAVSLEKGYDPREFTLISFGGASGLVIGRVADQLAIPKVVIPQHTGVFSAFGLLRADIRRTRSLGRIMPARGVDLKEVEKIYRDLEEELKQAMTAEGGSARNVTVLKSCDMRYVGQAYEINVPFPNYSGPLAQKTIKKLTDLFHTYHQKKYNHSAKEEPVELVCFRVLGILPIQEIKKFSKRKAIMAKSPLKGHRKVYFGKKRGMVNCPVYARENMKVNAFLKGPAIIEDPGTTVVVYPGHKAAIDPMGNIFLHTKG